ncbi:MAG TPA: BTAD domain-containing putative transcriptional regulator [Xanthobacteraceae bacterium]|nr:BTAD domain-containing putative transcriptional regulator [Xanthobacteraceae bacterium]
MNKPAILPKPDDVVPLGIDGLSGLRVAPSTGRSIVRIHLLGSMRATSYLGDNVLPRGKKARAILGCLCLMSGERMPRARLASMLWDRVPDAQARTSFRQALRELSRAFGDLAGELISADRDTVRLNLDLCWIDAVALLTRNQSQPSALRSDLASLCGGELLEESAGSSVSFDHWLFGERSRFTDQLRTLLETELHELTRRSGDGKHIADVARRLIAFDPTHEGATRILMRALADMGERAQALREFARCREALKNTLDVAPSPETHALFEAIRSGPDRDRGGAAVNSSAFEMPRPQPASRGRYRLRVGVLPLIGSRSRNEENLGFSLSQEIAAALARFRWFDVIAPVSLSRRSRELGVSDDLLMRKQLDYVLDGAISGAGDKFHISVRLLDLSEDARPVWSDRIRLSIGTLHTLDELVTARIVGQIDPIILFIEGQPKRREHYGATGLLLLAMPLMYSMERQKYEEAGDLINRALTIDPDNAMVAAWAAYWQVFHIGQGWAQDANRAFRMAKQHALKAIRLDPDNAEALGIYAHVCSFLNKDFDNAVHFFDRALRLNPNLAFIWALSSATYSYIGEPEAALQRLARYRDLAPFDPYHSWFEYFYTIAYIFKGDYENAVAIGQRVVTVNPDFVNGYKPLIASLGHLGRREEARPYVDRLLALEPNFTVERFGQVYPIKHETDRERYMTGLRLAGVPDR